LESLLFHNKLQWLNVAHNRNLKFDSFRYFGDYLTKNLQLRVLDLSGILIDKRSAEALAAGLAHPKCFLAVIRLMDCGLKPGTFDFVSTLDILARGLQKSRVVELNVRYNGLDGSSSAKTLQTIISRCTTLERLDLRNNELRSGISFVAAALEYTSSLQDLLLWENGIDDKGLLALSQGLRRNRSLRFLDLSYNPLANPDAFSTFKEAIISHPTLTVLALASTKMDSIGAVAMAEVLPENRRLRRLNLANNSVGLAGLMALNLAMKMNNSLISIELHIDGSELEQQRHLTEILNACEKNKKRLAELGEEIPREVKASRSLLSVANDLLTPLPFSEITPVTDDDSPAVEISSSKFNEMLQTTLGSARETAALLSQIADNKEESDKNDLAKDLADRCRSHLEKLATMVSQIENEGVLMEALEVNDILHRALDKYHFMIKRRGNKGKAKEILSKTADELEQNGIDESVWVHIKEDGASGSSSSSSLTPYSTTASSLSSYSSTPTSTLTATTPSNSISSSNSNSNSSANSNSSSGSSKLNPDDFAPTNERNTAASIAHDFGSAYSEIQEVLKQVNLNEFQIPENGEGNKEVEDEDDDFSTFKSPAGDKFEFRDVHEDPIFADFQTSAVNSDDTTIKKNVLLKNVFKVPQFDEENKSGWQEEIEEFIRGQALLLAVNLVDIIIEEIEGCAFLKCKSEEDAEKVKEHFNGHKLKVPEVKQPPQNDEKKEEESTAVERQIEAELISEFDFFQRFPLREDL